MIPEIPPRPSRALGSPRSHPSPAGSIVPLCLALILCALVVGAPRPARATMEIVEKWSTYRATSMSRLIVLGRVVAGPTAIESQLWIAVEAYLLGEGEPMILVQTHGCCPGEGRRCCPSAGDRVLLFAGSSYPEDHHVVAFPLEDYPSGARRGANSGLLRLRAGLVHQGRRPVGHIIGMRRRIERQARCPGVEPPIIHALGRTRDLALRLAIRRERRRAFRGRLRACLRGGSDSIKLLPAVGRGRRAVVGEPALDASPPTPGPAIYSQLS